jgi:hypothetical protein
MVTLEDFTYADTNYLGKLNANNAALKAAVEALQAQVGGAAGSAVQLGKLLEALFGSTAAVIGSGSYACAIAGQTVTVAAGYAWLPGSGAVVRLAAPGVVDLTGLADGTYYIKPDAAGAPVYSPSAADALFSVVKTGTALSSLTRLAAIAWAQPDWTAAQNSSVLGAFTSLDARLEAIEAAEAALFITGAFVAGKPANGALLFAILPSAAATFAAGFAGSRAKAGVAATAQTVLSIRKNGIEVGTITFAAGATAGVFAAASQVVVGTTDELTIVNQATADATLADIRFALHGTR